MRITILDGGALTADLLTGTAGERAAGAGHFRHVRRPGMRPALMMCALAASLLGAALSRPACAQDKNTGQAGQTTINDPWGYFAWNGPLAQPPYAEFGAGLSYLNSSTTFKTPSSKLHTNADGALVDLSATVQGPGGLFATGRAAFGPATGGSFTEGTTTGRITSGTIYTGYVDVGAMLYNVRVNDGTFIVGPYIGYGTFSENLYGRMETPPSVFSPFGDIAVSNQFWEAMRVGFLARVWLEHFQVSMHATYEPWVQSQVGAFTGTGRGFEFGGEVSTMVPGVDGLWAGLFGQYSSMCASGNLPASFGAAPIPVETHNSDWRVGVSLSRQFQVQRNFAP